MKGTVSSRSFLLRMKKTSKNIVVCILSAVVLFTSTTSAYITAYATEEETEHGGGGHGHDPSDAWREKLRDFMANVGQFSAFVGCQGLSLIQADYAQFSENLKYMLDEKNEINSDYVAYDEATDTITMDITPLLNTLAGQIGLVIVPAESEVNGYVDIALSIYGSRNDYFCTTVGWHNFTVYCGDLESIYLVKDNNGRIKSYDKITLEKVSSFTTYYHGDGGSVVTSIGSDDGYPFYASNVKDHVPFAYWSSMEMLQRFLNGSTYLGSSFGKNGTITIPVSDLEKDWESAYNSIIDELDEIKETTGQRPTQEQIDDAIKKVLGDLKDIEGNLGDIGDDVEDIAKTLDDLYKLLGECKELLESLNGSLSEGVYNQEQILASLNYLKLINDNLSQFHNDYAQSNAVLLEELEAIRALLSGSLSPGIDTDTKELMAGIDKVLQDISIFMKDRLLSVLEELSGSSTDINSALGNANITLEEIKDILSRMEASDIDTSTLEEALEKVREAIAETGEANSKNLSDMKELLSDIQDVLIEMKSGMAAQNDYTEVLDNIYSLMQDMYK